MKTFRPETIAMLAHAICGDEFSDAQQYETAREQQSACILPMLVDFVKRNLVDGITLEAGCGSGLLLQDIPSINWLVDPSDRMISRARATIQRLVEDSVLQDGQVKAVQGVTECLEFVDGTLSNVIFLNGFFQVRSDYESLIEINRVLCHGGRFIFNILCDDVSDIICGRVLGLHNYIRMCQEFGFAVVEQRRQGEHGLICLEKVTTFEPAMLRKLQLVKAGDDTYRVLNFCASRDGKLL